VLSLLVTAASWVSYAMCVLQGVFCVAVDAEPGTLSDRVIRTVKITKGEKKQHIGETSARHINLCSLCSNLPNVLVSHTWDQLPVMGCLY